MKAQILEKLIQGNLKLSHIIGIVFIRVVKVMAASLLLTLIVWLVWLGKFTYASFLAGAVFGLSVFLILNLLRYHTGYRGSNDDSDAADKARGLTDPEEIQPKVTVED